MNHLSNYLFRIIRRYSRIMVWFAVFTILSCRDFLDVDPPNSVVSGHAVFSDGNAAESAVVGIYHAMLEQAGFAGHVANITTLTGLSSDELFDTSVFANARTEFYHNNVIVSNGDNKALWSISYNIIYAANVVIERLSNSPQLATGLKDRLIGEAKFIRALCYFYLVNLYGDVPLLTSTDYRVNRLAARTQTSVVYDQIVADLEEARQVLPPNFQLYNNERVRPTAFAAAALLARVYLYTQEWANAEALSTTVIENTSEFSLLTNLDEIFLKNSKESIWQLMPVNPRYNTYDGNAFVLTSKPPYFALNENVREALRPDDIRLRDWIGSYDDGNVTYYYPFKYKVGALNQPVTEYLMVLRLAEQYLIRAEARAQQDKLLQAIGDLDMIRDRAQLPSIQTQNSSIDRAGLLAAIMQERRVELFTEWGHRWLDLKRTDRTDELAEVKPGWNATDSLYPIPEDEMLRNPNLTPQNTGY